MSWDSEPGDVAPRPITIEVECEDAPGMLQRVLQGVAGCCSVLQGVM